jgi:hypothetical protein
MRNYVIEICSEFGKKHPKRFYWLAQRLNGIIELGESDEMLLWRYDHTITALNRHIKLYEEGYNESMALMHQFKKEIGRSSYVLKRSVDKIGHDVEFLINLRNVLENDMVKEQYKSFSKDLGPEKLTPIMKKVKSQVRSGLRIQSKT